jgi:hypothetical protein
MDYSNLFPIAEYYKRVVMPINPRKYRMKSEKMMVCPVHDDVNPSMGIIKGKDGKEIYHCFGCNSWGDVVGLHKRVSKRLFNRYMSEEDSLRDLCRIFGVDYSEVSAEGNEEDLFDADIRRDQAILKATEAFDISDFRERIRQGKSEKRGAAYFNTLVMIMVDSVKSKEG